MNGAECTVVQMVLIVNGITQWMWRVCVLMPCLAMGDVTPHQQPQQPVCLLALHWYQHLLHKFGILMVCSLLTVVAWDAVTRGGRRAFGRMLRCHFGCACVGVSSQPCSSHAEPRYVMTLLLSLC